MCIIYCVHTGCSDSNIADVVLAVPPNSTPTDSHTALVFLRNVTLGWDAVNENHVRVALVPKTCAEYAELTMGVYRDREELLDKLDAMQYKESATEDVLKFMRMVSFAPENGARHNAKRVAILIVEDTSQDWSTAIYEADEMRTLLNVELFVIGVGNEIDPAQLQALATTPVDQHVHHVAHYSELNTLVEKLRSSICVVPGQLIQPSI